MSKRSHSHTTEVGCIACSDLGSVGAGKECWLLDTPSLRIALHSNSNSNSNSLALSTLSLILILTCSDSGLHRVRIRPDLDPAQSEHVTALEFLVFDQLVVLAVGTSSGHLMFYSRDGRLIHRQIVYTAKILKFRVRETKRDLTQDISSEEFCVVFPGSIARFDGSDIKSMLQRWFQEKHLEYRVQTSNNDDPEDSGNSFARLPYQLWNISKYGVCVDGAITGIIPPPLIELQSGQRYYCAIAIGRDAVISAYRLSENRNRSIVGAILSRVVPATFSTISSFSKMIWRSKSTPQKKKEEKPQPFAQASSLTCLKDHPRKGEKLTLSPSGTLAAITDSLGRILLLDTQALVVVRLWKGYRDANCLFLEMLVNNTSASQPAPYEYVKSDYCLCLAIHAPRKGIVEVWQMRTGLRLLTIPCPKGSIILQPTYRFGSSMVSSSRYIPLEVFILNGDSGQILVLNRSLN